MKELFRERDATIVGYYQSVLESEGISTFIRNQNAVTMMGTEIPIPEFFPALCVVNDDDYDQAMAILKERHQSDAEAAESDAESWTCQSCNESNPGNFDICWSCESARSETP